MQLPWIVWDHIDHFTLTLRSIMQGLTLKSHNVRMPSTSQKTQPERGCVCVCACVSSNVYQLIPVVCYHDKVAWMTSASMHENEHVHCE